ncbi:MAG: GNAT family N-acetyltransferase [Bdellovibrionota bacterium]
MSGAASSDDGYVDEKTGFWVFSEAFLRRRGTCCATGCRHCPWRAEKRFDWVRWTDDEIARARGLEPARPKKMTTALWRDLPTSMEEAPITLRRVESDEDWRELTALRLTVERAYGLDSPELVRELIAQTRRCVRELSGAWYFARLREGGELVGEIGLIPFTRAGFRFVRFQDVDILPAHQGKGLGNALLSEALAEASRLGARAVCLKADTDDWPLEWYLARGFEALGEWES